MNDTVKIICYLCPSIPYELFDTFSEELSKVLNLNVEIEYDPTSSGPMSCDNTLNNYDLALLCSPSYLTVIDCPNNKMELLKYNFVYKDERNIDNEPVYYSDVMVHDKSISMKNFFQKNLVFGYNDLSSLSGYYSMVHELDRLGKTLDAFKEAIESGSHLKTIDMLSKKEIDIACIDSICVNNFETDGLIKIGYLGPNPIQPILINSESRYREIIEDRFQSIDVSRLKRFGLIEIKEINDALYDKERELLNR